MSCPSREMGGALMLVKFWAKEMGLSSSALDQNLITFYSPCAVWPLWVYLIPKNIIIIIFAVAGKVFILQVHSFFTSVGAYVIIPLKFGFNRKKLSGNIFPWICLYLYESCLNETVILLFHLVATLKVIIVSELAAPLWKLS